MLSIIVPAYNVEKYLEKCIKSLVTQKDIEYEIIIIDDGANDSTGKIADYLSETYRGIVRVIHQENKGLGGARNTGIINAKGEYIAFVDSDDFLINNAFGLLFKQVEYEDFDILCFDHMEVFDGDNISLLEDNSNLDICIEKKDNLSAIKSFFKDEVTSYSWDKIYKKNLFVKNNIYFSEKTYFEDLRVSYEVITKCNTLVKTNLCAYMYVQRPNSITKSLTIKHYNDYVKEYNKICDNINCEIKKILKNEILIFKLLKYNSSIRILSNISKNSNSTENLIKPNIKLKELIKLDVLMKEKITFKLGEYINLYKLIRKIRCFFKSISI